MNKIYCLITAAILASGCTKLPHVAFTGKAPGLNDAVFLITDAAGNSVAGQNIVNGNIKVDTVLENTGYGSISINRNGSKDKHDFEVYLEPGQYTIDVDTAHLDRYPKITSSSKIQKELSAYNVLQDEASYNAQLLVTQLEEKMGGVNVLKMTEKQYYLLSTRLAMAQAKVGQVKLKAFQDFMQQYPNNIIAARVMETMDYAADPVAFNAIFNKLSPAAKNSDEGKAIGKKLSRLMRVLPGADAPAIAGATPDGKKFDAAKLDKKIYVVDFWKAGNQVSRMNHQDMISGLLKKVDPAKVGLISISLDSKRNWWTTAIKDDKLSWPQYSDLKGNESENAANWVITTIPTFYLVDGRWRIVARDVSLSRLEFEINYYLKHQASNSKNFSL